MGNESKELAMPQRPNESHFEEVTIERLKLLGYVHLDGGERAGLKICPLVKRCGFTFIIFERKRRVYYGNNTGCFAGGLARAL